MQEDYFSEGSLRVSRMLECIKDFFQRQSLPGGFVSDLPHVPVSATTQFLDQVIFLKNVLFDFLAHFL